MIVVPHHILTQHPHRGTTHDAVRLHLAAMGDGGSHSKDALGRGVDAMHYAALRAKPVVVAYGDRSTARQTLTRIHVAECVKVGVHQ